jgi:uracil-DNA glycosylase family 4
MIFERSHNYCTDCALDGKMKVFGLRAPSNNNGIMLLGEAPGAAEEAEGTPFTGPSGRLLNWALKTSNIQRHRTWITNVLLCRPPVNDIGSIEAKSAKQHCSKGLDDELRAAKQAGIKVIVALGETAMRALGIEGSPATLRGSVLEAKGFFVIPTYHPAFLYRNNWTRQMGGSASHTAIWLSDLNKAREVARPGWHFPAEHFNIAPTIADLARLWEQVQSNPNLVLGVDIETTSVNPRYGEIVVVGLATSAEDAIVVPLLQAARDKKGNFYGVPYWSNAEAGRARFYLERILTTAKQYYQYCFFDVPYLRAHGFEVPDSAIVCDSMLLHEVVSPETEHNLGFITSVYGQTPYWKDAFKTRAGNIFSMNESEMRTYNARDAVVLHQIIPAMFEHAKELNLMREWEEEVAPMIRPLMIMQEKGVKFDFKRLAAFKVKLEKILREKEASLKTLGKLPDVFSFSSTGDVGLFLFGVVPAKAKSLQSWEFEVEVPAKPTKKDPDRATKVVQKIIWGEPDEKAARRALDRSWKVLASHKLRTLEGKSDGTAAYKALLDLENLITETKPLYIIPGYAGPRTSGGSFATDKNGILSLRIAAQNRLEYLEALKTPREEELAKVLDLLSWLDAFTEFRNLEKLFNAFTKYEAREDGRIHPSWRFVSTGRLSCSRPNLMQLPKGKDGDEDAELSKEIRRFFIAPEGWSMVSADFENAEVALLAYDVDDPSLIEIYESGANIHDMNTQILFNLEPSSALWKEGRKAAKVFQFGGLSYGGGDREIHRKIVQAAPKLNLTFAAFVEAKSRWMEAHSKYLPWREAIEKEVLEKRIIYNAFGRARIFLDNDRDIIKEAMNFRIQSAIASIINRVIVRIQARIDAHKPSLRGYPILQNHDQLVYECPDEEVGIFSRFVREEMTRSFLYNCVQRSLRIDLSTGKTFGDLE